MIVARSIKIAATAVASTVLAAPICLILTIFVMCVPEASYLIPHYPFCNEDAVEYAETVPQTSATILGLANFGFLLGVRLNRPEMRTQYDSLAVAFAAIVVVTILQMALIMYAHGGSLYQPFYYYAMSVTAGALVLVGFCFVRIVAAGSRAEKREVEHRDDIEDDVADPHNSDPEG